MLDTHAVTIRHLAPKVILSATTRGSYSPGRQASAFEHLYGVSSLDFI
jgi:hypothetical protein